MSDFNDTVIAKFRANDGVVDRFGDRLVLMHHIGARSGIERIAPVWTVPDGSTGWFVAASKAGAPDHPAWYHNLKAHPRIVIEAPGEGRVDVVVEELDGEARDAAWAQFTGSNPAFAQYEANTARQIPVLLLRRV